MGICRLFPLKRISMKHKALLIKMLERRRESVYKSITRTFTAGGDRGSAVIKDIVERGDEDIEVTFMQTYSKEELKAFKELEVLEEMILEVKQEQ